MRRRPGFKAALSQISVLRIACALALCVETAAGCGLLAPEPGTTRFFILTPVKPPSTPATDSLRLALGLGPIRFPDYLKRTQFVTRTGPNSVRVSESDRWAEPLDASFRQVMALNLARLVGTDQIVLFPWYSSTHIDYQVELDVSRFDTDTTGTAHLVARWMVRDTHGRALISQSSNLTAQAPTADPAAAAGALSQVLGELSREIASVIDQAYVGLKHRGRS
jgi:uncharacterized lipoprotein YmbA